MLFYQVGELFQSYAVGKSRKSIASLMDIRPDYANVERDGKLLQVDPEEVAVGDTITVKAGEKIPLDGLVLEGSSLVDTAALTGESVPRQVRPGDSVISGCVNQNGLLRVQVTKAFGESTVQKILDLVENASSKKARPRTSSPSSPGTTPPWWCFCALALAVVPPLFVGGWTGWVQKALIFLVVSCPCALVISVPLSFFGGIGGASRQGILVKGGNYLEVLADTELVVFDKTGTLTKGVFQVTAIHPEGVSQQQLLELAALAESYSDHPSPAPSKRPGARRWTTARVGQVEELSGRGVRAQVDGKGSLGGQRQADGGDRPGLPPQRGQVGTVVHVAARGPVPGVHPHRR